jgi:undecaprenyl-diphosphatase
MNSIEHLNQTLFLLINATPHTASWIIQIAAVFADNFILGVPVLLLIMWLWGGAQYRRVAVMAFCVCFISLGLNQLIGLAWQHPRPSVMGLGHTFIAHAMDSSFPSDHMTVFSALAVTFFFQRLIKLGLITGCIGIIVGWSRVFLGAHFPFDMVGAVGVTFLGYAIVAVLWLTVGAHLYNLFELIYRKLFAMPIHKGWVKY